MKKRFVMMMGLFISVFMNSLADGKFKIQAGGNANTTAVHLTICNDTSFVIPDPLVFLRGLSVSGSIIKNSPDYIVRIILKDNNGVEHLVMESYEELCSTDTIVFNGHAEETCLLNCIKADSLLLYVHSAILQLDTISSYSVVIPRYMAPAAYNVKINDIRQQQAQAKVEFINSYNSTHNKFWRADITPFSIMSYEERKRSLGFSDGSNTGGFEYYAYGIFEVGDQNSIQNIAASKYVDSFDWRSRHGKNWMTPPKDQQRSGYCAAFASVGCVEALTNLFYNRIIDLDLSEQEAAVCCCSDIPNPYVNGMLIESPLSYIRDVGVCDEFSYPFENNEGSECKSDSIIPNEKVSIDDYMYYPSMDEEQMKAAIIHKGPIITRAYMNQGLTNHATVFLGYGRLTPEMDEVLFVDSITKGRILYHEIDLTPLYGKTFWIFKESHGNHYMDDGYGYIMFHDQSMVLDSIYTIDTPITTLHFDNSFIVCEDADGDGYYFWGIGPKPAHAPNGIPDEPDGDDSSADYGPMNKYGYLKVLNPSVATTIMVNDSVTVDDTEYLYNHIQVNNNGVLMVETDTEFWGELKLTVKSGGTFIVDGIVIDNVELSMESGSHLIVKNGGTLKLRSGKSFYAPTGAIVDTSSGNILP